MNVLLNTPPTDCQLLNRKLLLLQLIPLVRWGLVADAALTLMGLATVASVIFGQRLGLNDVQTMCLMLGCLTGAGGMFWWGIEVRGDIKKVRAELEIS